MSSERNDSKLTSEEESLINKLIDKETMEIKPLIDHNGITFEGLEEVVEDYGGRKLQELFKSLVKKGYLLEKEYENVIYCPNCTALHVYSKYSCPQCQSINVIRVELLEHLICGYIGEKREFVSGSNLICPKCERDLGPVNVGIPEASEKKESADYNIVGFSYLCERCNHRFDKPNVVHICQKCGAVFDYKNSRYEKLHAYEFSEKIEEIAPSRAIRDALRLVEKTLTDKGYEAELEGRVVGRSGGEHSFDIVARKNSDILIVDLSPWGNQNDLISLLGKKMDVEVKSTILIDLSGNEDLSTLGKVYDISILNGRDEDFEQDLAGYLDGLVMEGRDEDDKPRSWRERISR